MNVNEFMIQQGFRKEEIAPHQFWFMHQVFSQIPFPTAIVKRIGGYDICTSTPTPTEPHKTVCTVITKYGKMYINWKERHLKKLKL